MQREVGAGRGDAVPGTGVALTFRWWQWLPFQPWRLLGFVPSADEVPVALPRNGAVAVGSPTAAKWIAFDCPCRSGHRIMLNLDPARRPFWRVGLTGGGRLSIRPSVDYAGDRRRCHYFVDDGAIRWAEDSR